MWHKYFCPFLNKNILHKPLLILLVLFWLSVALLQTVNAQTACGNITDQFGNATPIQQCDNPFGTAIGSPFPVFFDTTLLSDGINITLQSQWDAFAWDSSPFYPDSHLVHLYQKIGNDYVYVRRIPNNNYLQNFTEAELVALEEHFYFQEKNLGVNLSEVLRNDPGSLNSLQWSYISEFEEYAKYAHRFTRGNYALVFEEAGSGGFRVGFFKKMIQYFIPFAYAQFPGPFTPNNTHSLFFTVNGGDVTNHAPTLTFSDEAGYQSDTEGKGVEPNKGIANTTPLTFKVIYTDADNNPPQYVSLDLFSIFGTPTTSTPTSTLTVDSTAINPLLRDGDYTNGEQFTLTSTFPKNSYSYRFLASDGQEEVTLPAGLGALAFTTGYSSVAFLPGHQASRLYKDGIFGTEDRLWYPNAKNDIQNLALSSSTGESIDPNIYTRDVLDEIAGTVNIYKSFLSDMNQLVASGVIANFEPLPYDWRKDQKDVVTEPIAIGPNGEQYSMVEKIEALAANSDTGRVTLITHSNGGLVAKELIEALKLSGEEKLVDRIIMVAAPELGTPKAVSSMLHGENFLGPPNQENSREFGENMKSAYTLLPSREYFNQLSTAQTRPIIEFSTTTPVTQYFRDIYGDSISDYDTLRTFLLGEGGARLEPQASLTNEPNVLKEQFLNNAENRHTFQDTWAPPAGIDVIEIIGWGLDTLRGVRYESVQKDACPGPWAPCPQELIDPQPLITTEGDGTVVHISAEALGGEQYWVNIKEYNRSGFIGSTINRDHKNLLEVAPLRELLVTLLQHKATSTLPDFIVSTRPETQNVDKRLRFGVHSPVALNLYDEFGRHTGPAVNPDSQSNLSYIEEQIPNTYYWQIGEGQYSGTDVEGVTTLVLQGEEIGTFTLDIDEVVGDNITKTTTFADIPVTTDTIATLKVSTSTDSVQLHVDIDGDGTSDVTIDQNNQTPQFSLQILIAQLKNQVVLATIEASVQKKLTKEIAEMEEHLNEGKIQKIREDIEKLRKIIKKALKKEKISTTDADKLGQILDNFEKYLPPQKDNMKKKEENDDEGDYYEEDKNDGDHNVYEDKNQ